MISLDTVEQEIMDLERRDTTYAVVERLAWLYTVRDHLRPTVAVAEAVPADPSVAEGLRGSEFKEICCGVPVAQLMDVLDSHMDAVRVVCPKEYDAVMAKIRSLHDAH